MPIVKHFDRMAEQLQAIAVHSGSSWGTVEETIDASTSLKPYPRSSSRPIRA